MLCCFCGSLICGQIRLCFADARGFAIISRLYPSEASWGLGGVCSVFGPLRGARETDLRIAWARAAVRPAVQAPRRMPRNWGHWAHLMTTAHRGRSSDGGFVAQFLRLRKFVRASEPGRFGTVFWACLHFWGPCVWEPNPLTHKVVSTALSPFKHSKQKVHLAASQPRSRT